MPSKGSKASAVVLERFAIMAVDPGGTTGVAQGFFNPGKIRRPTMKKVIARALERDAIRVSHIMSGPREDEVGYSPGHVHRLYAAWSSFLFKANVGMSLPMNAIFLVVEDFQLRQRSADLSPVQVTAGLECLIESTPRTGTMGYPRPIKQPVAEAKTYATDARLREWGLWTVGKEHGRDATRHMVLAASKLIK